MKTIEGIQMVDLIGQYKKIKSQIDNTIIDVVESSKYINGPQVHKFQKDLENYLNVKHVIPCANGTDALQIAIMGLGLKSGDEVITADFTFAATVEVIALLGLTPVLVDVYQDSFNIDIDALEKAITPKTKAIIPVHLFGQCANMEAIMDIAKKYNLFVIEDTAQALGACYIFKDGTKKKAGTIGNVGTTSFFPSKNLGCYGDGGAIFTNDDKLSHTIRAIVNHGMYKRYYHDLVGVNSRLDSIQAAILRIKLSHLDSYSNARREAAYKYNRAFLNNKNIITPATSKFTTHVFNQYTLKLKNTNSKDLQKHLTYKKVPFAIYYPVALHKQKAYANKKYNDRDFKVTNRLVESVISLPMHTELSNQQITYISQVLNSFI